MFHFLTKSGPKAASAPGVAEAAAPASAVVEAPSVPVVPGDAESLGTEVEPGVLLGDQRTNIPPRTPEVIEALLKYETPAQTASRIQNDLARYRLSRAGAVAHNPQARQLDPEAEVSGVGYWGN